MLSGIATRAPTVQLLGRQRERERLDRLLGAARDRHGGVLVLYGDAGVGKTALLEYAIEAGAGFPGARTHGVGRGVGIPVAAPPPPCSPRPPLLAHPPG